LNFNTPVPHRDVVQIQYPHRNLVKIYASRDGNME